MNLFLDTSVLLAACGSAAGASRAVFHFAPENHWTLIASPYVLSEVVRNLIAMPPQATADWIHLRRNLAIVDDIVTLDRIAVFAAAKDRPILFTALAWANVLVTLDRRDFGDFLGQHFYGLEILTPTNFVERERTAGRLVN